MVFKAEGHIKGNPSGKLLEFSPWSFHLVPWGGGGDLVDTCVQDLPN